MVTVRKMAEVYPGMSYRDCNGRVTPISQTCDSDSDKVSLMGQFGEETTLHGVGFWLNPKKSKTSRVLYFIVWLAMATVMGYYLYSNIIRYLQFETKVSISSKDEKSLMFPSITICPENPFPKSKVGGSAYALDKLVAPMRNGPYPIKEACFDANLKDTFPDRDKATQFILDADAQEASEAMMVSFRQVIQECRFNMSRIDCSQLFIGHMTSMGRCFTFNYAGKYSATTNSMLWTYSEKIKVHRYEYWVS